MAVPALLGSLGSPAQVDPVEPARVPVVVSAVVSVWPVAALPVRACRHGAAPTLPRQHGAPRHQAGHGPLVVPGPCSVGSAQSLVELDHSSVALLEAAAALVSAAAAVGGVAVCCPALVPRSAG